MQRSGGKSVEGARSGVRTRETAVHIHMWRICNAERQTAVCGDGLASSNVEFSEYHAHTHTHRERFTDSQAIWEDAHESEKFTSPASILRIGSKVLPAAPLSACNAAPIINA